MYKIPAITIIVSMLVLGYVITTKKPIANSSNLQVSIDSKIMIEDENGNPVDGSLVTIK